MGAALATPEGERGTSFAEIVTPLTESQAEVFVANALARLEQDGVSSQLIARLGSVQVAVGTLGGGVLALAETQSDAIIFDDRAAGYGWFEDDTPLQDEEFAAGQALPNGAAAGRMDLFTAALEELGAAIGLTGNVFTAPLAAGTRDVAALDAAFVQAGR